MLDTKALIVKILSKMHSGYGTKVNISTYNSASNAYTAPSDGLLQIVSNYRATSYVIGYVNNELVVEASSPSSGNATGNTVSSVPVFKGQKIYVTRSSTYSYAYFIPFVGGVARRLLKALKTLTLERGWVLC